MKIASWNVNSLRVRLPQVQDWLQQHQPDVLALQETKVQDHDFPRDELVELGYQAVFKGQKTFNGVAILSRQPANDVITEFADYDDPQCRLLAATIDDVRIINVYVPNGQLVDSDKYHYKLTWLKSLHQLLQQQLKIYSKLVVLGDFNIAPQDRDVHDPEVWRGHVLVSEAERQALQQLMQLGLIDVVRQFQSADKLFSWWDYRGGQFWKNAGLRIDLILASQALADDCQACDIDTRPRKLKRPSDHAPVVANFSVVE